MTKPYVYYRNVKDREPYEREATILERVDEMREDVEFEEFAAACEYEYVAEKLGYGGDGLILSDDWSVSFYRSRFGAWTCYVLAHTETDFLFLPREVVGVLWLYSVPPVTDDEWRRVTGFGNGGVDPRPE